MLNRKRFYVTTAALFGSVMMGLNCGAVYALDDSPAVAAEVAKDTTVKDTYISYADGVKKNNVNTLVKAYVELPNSVKVKLVRDHVRILLYDKLTGPAEKMTYAASSYSAPEYFSYDKAGDAKLDNKEYAYQDLKKATLGKVKINNALIRISSGKYEKEALYHSIGHYVDDMNSKTGQRLGASQSDSFSPFYTAYKDKIRSVDEYAAVVTSNQSEMFAECVRLFFQNPGALQSISPELFNYTANAINVMLTAK